MAEMDVIKINDEGGDDDDAVHSTRFVGKPEGGKQQCIFDLFWLFFQYKPGGLRGTREGLNPKPPDKSSTGGASSGQR